MLSCFFVDFFGAALIYDNENAVQEQYNIVKIKILSSDRGRWGEWNNVEKGRRI